MVVRVGAAALVGALALSAGFLWLGGDEPPEARAELVTAERGTVSSVVSAAGTTVDAHTRQLAFSADGNVERIYVKVGDRVDAGQLLAKIDDTRARERYEEAKAELAAAEETLERVRNGTAGGAAGAAAVAGRSRSGGGTGAGGTGAGGVGAGTAREAGGGTGGGKGRRTGDGTGDGTGGDARSGAGGDTTGASGAATPGPSARPSASADSICRPTSGGPSGEPSSDDTPLVDRGGSAQRARATSGEDAKPAAHALGAYGPAAALGATLPAATAPNPAATTTAPLPRSAGGPRTTEDTPTATPTPTHTTTPTGTLAAKEWSALTATEPITRSAYGPQATETAMDTRTAKGQPAPTATEPNTKTADGSEATETTADRPTATPTSPTATRTAKQRPTGTEPNTKTADGSQAMNTPADTPTAAPTPTRTTAPTATRAVKGRSTPTEPSTSSAARPRATETTAGAPTAIPTATTPARVAKQRPTPTEPNAKSAGGTRATETTAGTLTAQGRPAPAVTAYPTGPGARQPVGSPVVVPPGPAAAPTASAPTASASGGSVELGTGSGTAGGDAARGDAAGGGMPGDTPGARPSATCAAGQPGGGQGQGQDQGRSQGRDGAGAASGGPGASGDPQGSGRSGGPGGFAGRGGFGGSGLGRTGGGAGQGTGLAQAEATVTRAKGELEEAKEALAGVVIKAPVAGTVLSVAGTVGTAVAANTAFVTLGDLDELQVRAMVTQSDVEKLKVGQKAEITLATRVGERYPGRVTHIDPAATTSDGLARYGVLVAFTRRPRGLLLGQNATITVTTDTSGDAVYVPAQAVRTRADGTAVVTVATGGGTVERVVRTGVRGDRYLEIVDGLHEGDRVVMPASATSGEFPDGSFPDLGAVPSAAPS